MQGKAIGRPGIVTVSVNIKNKMPELVRVAGTAVIVFKTTLCV
ncbi:MAG: PhzF family phenazine biosynthesis protein [Deltaproteobacteria bacterium]|nr:PhzF family phenazine biosynthesis protein [Deltaproteobacteria bacterium]